MLAIAGAMAVVLSGALVAPPAATASVSTAATPAIVLSAAKKTTKTKITSHPRSAKTSRFGTTTKATFAVKAKGTKLRYKWQQHSASSKKWKTISGAKSAKYTAKASSWPSGTRFRVIVTGKRGKATSKSAKLTVLKPTATPARDAQAAFGLTGLTQGVDLSSWQYLPSYRVNLAAISSWAGKGGFTILRNGSGARPIQQAYNDACTGKAANTGANPVVEDCAYPILAPSAKSRGLRLGHYWFNGWISAMDTTGNQAFAGGHTPEASAAQFVTWLLADGTYTKASTDPLVLDIEAGSAWTKTVAGKKRTLTLRAWNSAEATAFLRKAKSLLNTSGYQANLYVYMGANHASKITGGRYYWSDVAPLARLWVASWGTNNGRIPSSQPKVGPWASRGGWSIWQYTSNARIAGSGVVELDADVAKPDAWTPR